MINTKIINHPTGRNAILITKQDGNTAHGRLIPLSSFEEVES